VRANLAPQPCIRLTPVRGLDHEAVIRFSGMAPRRRAHSQRGMQPCRYAGCRHLGSSSVARHIIMAGTEFFLVVLIAVGPLGGLAQHDPLWDFAKGDHAPQRDEQLASQGDDHLRLPCAPDALGAALEPLGQGTVLLEQ